ncbi:hypothetical protein GCM10023340_12870 [Nocardioides marinquilinus]|uniref:ABC transmembrane type-1 domain-containing protein n=1 Tax=Nocardioides marinquilinus TaxID=1210400 RepID=A0ABP9PE96_9ACTN
MIVLRDMVEYLTTWANWTGEGGMLALLFQQLLLTVTALAIALAVGQPIALWLGHLGRGGFLAINISNVGRAVPTFALLGLFVTADAWKDGIPVPWGDQVGWLPDHLPISFDSFPGTMELGPYGRAGAATLVALALFALPPIITNAYVAMREVSAEVKEAATGMGMSGWQRFRRVELPLAMPVVLSGARLALVQVWATATIAALVAGPGLGRVITDGFFRSNYGKGLAGALVVALVALVLELVAGLVQRVLDPVPRPAPSGGSPARGREKSAAGPTVSAADDVGPPR